MAQWSARYPALKEWDEGVRYEPTGTRSAGEVSALLTEVRGIVAAIVATLWADGALDARFMRDLDTW